jgi:uncharacterized coiled-coil DUF342 family protein|nr:MAG TPA: hypothetical protein [Caudoviricetes sp.]
MEREIIKLNKDVEHIKESTEEIKTGVSELIAQANKNEVALENLRGRLREAEHEMIEVKNELANLKSLVWRIAYVLAGAGSGTIGVLEIFGK